MDIIHLLLTLSAWITCLIIMISSLYLMPQCTETCGPGGSSGGNRNYVPAYVGQVVLWVLKILEVLTTPDNASVMGPNMLHLKDFERVIQEIDEYLYINTSTRKHSFRKDALQALNGKALIKHVYDIL